LIFLVPFAISLRFHHANGTDRMDGSISWMHPWIALGKYDFESRTFSMTFVRRFSFFWGVSDDKTPKTPVPQDAQERAAFADEKNKSEEINSTRREPIAPEKKIKSKKTKIAGPSDQPAREHSEKKEEVPIQKKGWKAALNKFKSNKVLFLIRQNKWRNKIISWAFRSLCRFIRLFKIRRIKVHVRAGLSDPASTGKAFGYWMGASNALELESNKRISMKFDPVFNEECLEVSGLVALQTSLARLALPVILAIVSFPYLSTLLVWRASKRLNFVKPS
jgi:hypothetical protein